MQKDSVLELRGIFKSFPGVKALQDVDFTLRKGEIHALMGENGAGKSTLIKVLTGVYSKDAGDIYIKKITEKKRLYFIRRRRHSVPESVRCIRRFHSVRIFP